MLFNRVYFSGVFLALGFLAASFVVYRRAKEEALEPEKIFDALSFVSLFALLGARIHFIIGHFSDFGFQILKWFWLTRYAGLSFYGGLVFGLFGLFWTSQRFQWSFWPVGDIFIFGWPVFEIFAYLGQRKFYLLPLPLLGFYLLLQLENRYRLFAFYQGPKGEANPGFLLLFYLIYESFSRFFLEIFGNKRLSWLSLLVFLAGLIALYWRSGREFKEDRKKLLHYCLSLKNKVRYKRKKKEARVKAGKEAK